MWYVGADSSHFLEATQTDSQNYSYHTFSQGKKAALCHWVLPAVSLCPTSRPDTTFLWFISPLKAIRYLVCNNYKWLIIKIVVALLILAMLGLFLYSMPGYMVKKLLGAWKAFSCSSVRQYAYVTAVRMIFVIFICWKGLTVSHLCAKSWMQ